LKTRFDRPAGLADENTLILDPATGTATFLYEVIRFINEQRFKNQPGAWNSYVPKKLLPRIFGFELLMAPYAVAHMKLAMLLEETGYKFEADQRLGVYLTNTLEQTAHISQQLVMGFLRELTEEANAAAEIKAKKPIMVVLGNPPYSGHSANRSVDKNGKLTFIGNLIEDYRFVEGQPLGERNPKWLQDDYVKFIRFGQWRIEQTKYGIIGFITNHAYLDNPTFRGMRQQLLNTFDEIYVYDLHGNSKRGETTPHGGKDENVFSIQQGVAILFCVKQNKTGCRAKVYHAHLWGKRERKYEVLSETTLNQTKWKELIPMTPAYLFIPHDAARGDEYEQGAKVTDIFPVNSMGITTGNDDLYVAFTREELKSRFRETLNDVKVAYRPFDGRHLQYLPENLARARADFMLQVASGANRILLTLRRPRNLNVDNFFISQGHTDKCVISSLDNAQLFPLYIYLVEKQRKRDWGKALTMALFETPANYLARKPNLDPYFLKVLAEKLKLPQTQPHGLPEGVTPEDIFNYAYAVFHSPTYRQRYAEFLKIDFPRLPLTSDVKLFRALAVKGAELVALHLLESPKVKDIDPQFCGKGDNSVEKVQYTDTDHRVWVNANQYFVGVPKNVWGFHVGGYQPCQKWLKDRKGRKLAYDDMQHYRKIVVAQAETIRLMVEIDAVIPKWPLE
jgi:predicted helicase